MSTNKSTPIPWPFLQSPPSFQVNASLLLCLRRLRPLLSGHPHHAPYPRRLQIQLRFPTRTIPPLHHQRRRKRPRAPPARAGRRGRQDQRPRGERNLRDSAQVGELRERMENALVRASRRRPLVLQDSRTRQDHRKLRNRDGIEGHWRGIRANDLSQSQFEARRPSPKARRRNPSQGPFHQFFFLSSFSSILFLSPFNFVSVWVTTRGTKLENSEDIITEPLCIWIWISDLCNVSFEVMIDGVSY